MYISFCFKVLYTRSQLYNNIAVSLDDDLENRDLYIYNSLFHYLIQTSTFIYNIFPSLI